MNDVTTRIPDLINCVPPRARRSYGRNHEPYWIKHGSVTDGTDYGSLRFSAHSIRSRQMVTFGELKSTFCYISAKTCSAQSGQGPGERYLAMELEVDPVKVDYSLHGVLAYWRDDEKLVKHYEPDAIWIDVEGIVTCTEVKASAGYFQDPRSKPLYDAAEAGFARARIRFDRLTEDKMRENPRRAFNITRAFADRLSDFTPRQMCRAAALVAEGGIALGELGEKLELAPASRLSVVNALMVRRVVAYDLNDRVNQDTMITAPPRVTSRSDIRSIDI